MDLGMIQRSYFQLQQQAISGLENVKLQLNPTLGGQLNQYLIQ